MGIGVNIYVKWTIKGKLLRGLKMAHEDLILP